MSRLLEFLLGSILIAVFTVAFMFFSALQYILKSGSITDCAWYASVRTWIDANGDGQIDRGEPPLSDVKIHVDDIENRLVDISWPAITDQEGDGQFNVSIPDCSETIFEIYVDIPNGYRVTTRSRIAVKPDLLGGSGAERVYYFGFVSDR